MKLLLLLSLVVLVGCNPVDGPVFEPVPKMEPVTKTHVGVGNYSMMTVAHDGHLFVVWDGNSKGGILHHPACLCQTNR